MGEYEGTFVSYNKYGNLVILLEDGEEESWPVHGDMWSRVSTLDLQVGDRVRVSVEFNSYHAIGIVQVDLETRALLARIEELERLIKGLTT